VESIMRDAQARLTDANVGGTAWWACKILAYILPLAWISCDTHTLNCK
jgi:hypothetical protein